MSRTYPKNWLSRRWHSLWGIWIVLFLVEHLLTNSQAALPLGKKGEGFVHAVNAIHHLPYVQVIEICLIGLPILWHAVYGVIYIFTAKSNSFRRKKAPSLTHFFANHAFTWQRLAAWILLIGIALHVLQMRFIRYPTEHDGKYTVMVTEDAGLAQVAKKYDITLHPSDKPGNVLATAPDIGSVILLNMRDVFKSPVMMILYSIFVISGVYHGFRGLWSFSIVWGAALTKRSQTLIAYLSLGLMILLGLLSFAAIWLTYWVTLK